MKAGEVWLSKRSMGDMDKGITILWVDDERVGCRFNWGGKVTATANIEAMKKYYRPDEKGQFNDLIDEYYKVQGG